MPYLEESYDVVVVGAGSFLIWIVVGPIYGGNVALQQNIGHNLIYTIAKVFATAIVMVYNFVTRKIFLEKK